MYLNEQKKMFKKTKDISIRSQSNFSKMIREFY